MVFQSWVKWGFPIFDTKPPAYRYHSLLPGNGQDGVVRVGPTSCGVYENMHVVVEDRGRDGLLKHHLDVLGFKDLLQRVESEPRELGLDQVGPVLHDGFKLDVPVRALPPAQQNNVKKYRTNKHKRGRASPRNQVQHVNTVCGAALGFTGGTGQLHAQKCEERLASQPVSHFHQAGVKVDLAGQGGNGQQSSVAHDEEGGYCLLPRPRTGSTSSDDEPLQGWASAYVKEAWVDVGSLLQNDDVPACALGR